MTDAAEWVDWVSNWSLVGVGVLMIVATSIATLFNDAALPLLVLQASIPLLLGVGFVGVGFRYRDRYRPGELRTIGRFVLMGLVGLFLLAGWMLLNARLEADGSLASSIVVVTAMTAGITGGLAVGVLVVARNRRERDLRETSRQLEAILDTVEAAIFIKDNDGRYQLMNEACKDLAGLDSATDPSGYTDYDLFDDDVADQFTADDARVLEHGETVRLEETVPTSGGDRTQLTLKSPLTDEDGAPVGICAVSTEITARKERERELTARSTAMEASIDGMAILNEDETYSFVNQAHAEVYGYDDPDAFIGESWEMCYSDDELDRFAEEVMPEIYEQGSWRGEATGQRRDGSTFPQELSLTVLEEGGMVCVVRDISERKAYERELERQNDRLETFAEIVSHDLRNPLSVAVGRVELLQEDVESEHLDETVAALSRMEELIDDILTLAREGREIRETESVEMREMADRCWAAVAATDADLCVEIEQCVEADRSRLKQLLENLFRNAIDHGGSGLTVTVGGLEDGFYVADDGKGIALEDRDQVFDHGHSTSVEGTGYGLSIVAEIAAAHDWEVAVTESDTGGARFEFTNVAVSPSDAP